MKAQMKYADRRLSPAAVILGGDEIAAGTVTIKDLDLGRDAVGGRHRQRRLARRAARASRPCRAPSWSPRIRAHRGRARPMRTEPPVPAEALAAIRAPFAGRARARVRRPDPAAAGPAARPGGRGHARAAVRGPGRGRRGGLPAARLHRARGARATSTRGGRPAAISMRARRSAPRRGARTGAEEFLQIGRRGVRRRRRRAPRRTPRSSPWPGERRRPAGAATCRCWLGDVGLFAAFIEAWTWPPPLAARLKRVASAGRGCCGPSWTARRQASRAGAPVSRLAGAAGRRCAKPRPPAVLEEVWALAGIEPVGGRRPGRDRRTAWSAAPRPPAPRR